MARRAAALLVLGAALVLAPLAPAARQADLTFRVAEPGDYIDSVDPALTGYFGDAAWLSAACASLMYQRDEPLPAGARIAPELATALPKVSADRRTYTFTIRKDARFNTGAPVTAADVAYTIDRLLNPILKSPSAETFLAIVGAQDVLDGKATSASGLVASGQTLAIRLTHPVGDFVAGAAASLCVVPAATPIDPAGLRPPVPSPAPYYVSEYVPSQRLVLERNTYYAGPRPQHVDRFVFDLTVDDDQAIDAVLAGTADYAWPKPDVVARRAPELAQRFGVNRSRFFVQPTTFLRMFVLNTSRPLLRNNVPLRRAINYAIERRRIVRAGGGRYAGTPTDQYLSPLMPGYVDARIYPLVTPNLKKARRLAKGHTRGGKLVLYWDAGHPVAQAEIVKQDLARIGLTVEIRSFPAALYFKKIATPTEPFDMAYAGLGGSDSDPGGWLTSLFDGASIGKPGSTNWSYFDSPLWNSALRQASRLPTSEVRYRVFGALDVRLARDAAPAAAYQLDNALALVSARTGCVVVKATLDLAAACLR
jgi:peptide/nickel transport system substrate-binding protein